MANITGPLYSIIDFKGSFLLMLVLAAFLFGTGAKILEQRNFANTGSKLIEINISEGQLFRTHRLPCFYLLRYIK